jgi:hypothetical protein
MPRAAVISRWQPGWQKGWNSGGPEKPSNTDFRTADCVISPGLRPTRNDFVKFPATTRNFSHEFIKCNLKVADSSLTNTADLQHACALTSKQLNKGLAVAEFCFLLDVFCLMLRCTAETPTLLGELG